MNNPVSSAEEIIRSCKEIIRAQVRGVHSAVAEKNKISVVRFKILSLQRATDRRDDWQHLDGNFSRLTAEF